MNRPAPKQAAPLVGSDAEKASDFARDLTEISRRHGVGISGEPTLFMLEQDDVNLRYDVDDESRLTLA